jgi:DNA-binding response OmpR family regulator
MSTNSNLICVIEDNTPIRKLLTTILEKSGFETVAFADGNSAFAWLTDNTPAAVLSDYVLPDADGKAIVDFIRQKPDGKTIPVVAVTGLAQVNDRERILDLGFDSYIAKPLQTSTFVDSVRTVIENKKNQ